MKSTTKILFVGLCLLGTALTASAQLKLHSNGNLSFKRTGSQPSSPIALASGGGIAESRYFLSYQGDFCGLHFYANNAQGPGSENHSYAGTFRCGGDEEEINVGIAGIAYSSPLSSSSGNPASIGVWGRGYSNTQGRYAYGVLGNTYTSSSTPYNSAAICGIASNCYPSNVIPDDNYAGLFVGKTKVAGDLTVTGSVNGVVITPSNRSESDMRSIGSEPIADKILGLSTMSFRYPDRAENSSQHPTFLTPDSITIVELEELGIDVSKLNEAEDDIVGKQVQDKQHYALSPDELEKVFPDLVYTDKDGGKAINYVEMVPLLVQCINELNARLTTLDGNKAASRKSGLSNSDDNTSSLGAASRVSPINAVLYQNTPNPFTAQTEIRFSLPDDAPASYIYIFDMTGKMQRQIPVNPSQQSVTINGYELSAGIYLYSLVVGGKEIDTKRMIITK